MCHALKRGYEWKVIFHFLEFLDFTFAINFSALDDCRLDSVIRKRRYNDNLVGRVQTQT